MEYFLAVVVSLIVQGTKKYITDKFTKYVFFFGVSVLAAGGFVWISGQDFYPAVMKIVIAASAFHNLILRRFESDEDSDNN